MTHYTDLANAAAEMPPESRGTETRLLLRIAELEQRIEQLEIRSYVLLTTLETHLVDNPVSAKDQYTTRVFNIVKANIAQEKLAKGSETK